MSDFYQTGVVATMHQLGKPVLAVCDRPYAVMSPAGDYSPALMKVGGIIPAGGIGPAGWNLAILSELERLGQT